MVSEKKKAPKLAKKTIVDVNAKHTDEEILALEAKDYALRFNEKDFRELPEDVIAELSSANARDYFIAKGAHGALVKNEKRKEVGFSGVEVVDPLRGKPHNVLKVFKIPKGWHHCWKRPDEKDECLRLGYILDPEEVETPGATRASSSRVIKRKDGTDDLVGMLVPDRLYQQHLEANAIQSKKRAGATMKEINRMVASANKNLADMPEIPNMTETTTTDEVNIVADIANRR